MAELGNLLHGEFTDSTVTALLVLQHVKPALAGSRTLRCGADGCRENNEVGRWAAGLQMPSNLFELPSNELCPRPLMIAMIALKTALLPYCNHRHLHRRQTLQRLPGPGPAGPCKVSTFHERKKCTKTPPTQRQTETDRQADRPQQIGFCKCAKHPQSRHPPAVPSKARLSVLAQ